MEVNFKKLHEDAVLPYYAHKGDAGLDMTATSDPIKVGIEDGGSGDYWCLEYKTGVAAEIPEGYVGLLFPRSSISKKDLIMANSVGVIDSTYRGEITFRFKEIGDWIEEDGYYKKGDRIGQLIIIPYPEIEPKWNEELSNTVRGKGGYGSSGN